MPHTHFVLQGKGGVGKSFVANLLAQSFIAKGTPALCIDTDPVNGTLHAFASLGVQRINILEGDEINTRQFDTLIELVAKSKTDVIVDNGASSFVPLSHYLISNEVASILQELGHTVIIHTVITGGEMLMPTLAGFSSLVTQFPASVPFVVWLNPYHGVIDYEGKGFTDTKVYRENKARVAGIVQIPDVKKETFGIDIENMLKARHTFEQEQQAKGVVLMAKQRLKIFERKAFARHRRWHGRAMTNDDDNIDDLLAELARKHKVVLGLDDPVAMLLTVNRFLLRETAASQEQLLQGFREAVATASSDWNKLANKRAEAILNATIFAAKNAVAAGAQEGVAAGLSVFLQTAERLSGRIDSQLKQVRRLVVGVAVTLVVLIAALGVLCVAFNLRR